MWYTFRCGKLKEEEGGGDKTLWHDWVDNFNEIESSAQSEDEDEK